MRAIGPVDDDPVHHQALLAYASDYGLLGAVLQPHGVTLRDPRMMAASLDHAIWLHRPFRMDDWILYVAESPAASGARGFTRGTFFTRSGELVASVAQEGLVRLKSER
jgi:acyl-CoA thioesterase-2